MLPYDWISYKEMPSYGNTFQISRISYFEKLKGQKNEALQATLTTKSSQKVLYLLTISTCVFTVWSFTLLCAIHIRVQPLSSWNILRRLIDTCIILILNRLFTHSNSYPNRKRTFTQHAVNIMAADNQATPWNWGRLSIKMSSYQYRNPHVKHKTVSRPSYL